ncbi:MAG: hypothetical protein FH756_18120 [Firmicutes bacterium]|nr:hypothetical protein [Bacillota bacterium]
MNNRWLIRGLALVIAVALVVAGYNTWQRYDLEKEHRGMEIAVAYNEVAELAELQESKQTGELLTDFGREGVTTVLFKEDTPQTLVNRGEFVVGTGQEMSTFKPGLIPAENFRPNLTYLVTDQKNAWERVRTNMQAKHLPMDTGQAGNGYYFISTPLTWDRLDAFGLGFPVELMEMMAREGFNILVQPKTWPQVTVEEIAGVFKPLYEIPRLAGVLFNDDKLPGYGYEESKVLFRAIGEQLDEMGVPLVQIEFTPQRGFGSVARAMDKQVVRLHTISKGEMDEYTPSKAMDRYLLAATDRNMRVLLVRFFSGVEYPDQLQVNRNFIENLSGELVEKGFEPGKASLFGSLNVSRFSIAAISLGVLAGGILLTLMLLPYRAALVLSGAGVIGWLALTGAILFSTEWLVLSRKIMALAAVIIFPTLAIVWGVGEKGLSPGRAVLRLMQISLLSLVGAALMVGLLADVGFMLKLDQFAGVKVAHLIPLVLLAGYFFFHIPRDENWLEKLLRTAKHPITMGIAAAGGVLGIILLIYVMRTGNADVGAVLPFEQQLRNSLQDLLTVRPRTKEFMLGHPLLLLLLYTGYRDVRFIPLLVLGAIGQVSMVNTFAHIHTPVVISLLRGFNGLWLGILGGLVLIALWKIGRHYWKRLPEVK